MSLPKYPKYRDSGVDWVGQMPSHWKTTRTKHLFDLMKRQVRDEDGVVTAFRDGEVTLRSNRRTDGFTNSLQEIGYQGVRRGDLVIHAMDAFAGAIGVSDSDGKSTPVYSVCRPIAGHSDSRYFARLMRHMALSGFIDSLAKGIRERSTEFRWAEAGNVWLPTPPIDEQAAIAAFLDRETARIDALIAEQEKLIALLAEKRQATISHAVTRGLNPDAPMKDSGVEWLGEVPAHWRVVRVRDIASVINGYPFDSKLFDETNGHPLLRIRDLNATEASVRYRGDYISAAEVTSTDILIGMDGDFNVGRWLGAGPALLNQRMCCVRTENEELSKFLFHVLPAPLKSINDITYSTTVKHLSSSSVEKIRLAIPDSNELSALAAFLEEQASKIDLLASEKRTAIALLNERRAALIAAAVTGQIDVRNV